MLILITYHFKQLIDTSKPLFSLYAILELILVSLLIPHLAPLIILPQEMSPNFMVQHPHNATFTIFNGQSDIDLRFAALRVMSHTRGCNFVLLEV